MGIKGRGRSVTSWDSIPAGLCSSSAHLVQCEPDEASSFTNPYVGPGTYAGLWLKLDNKVWCIHRFLLQSYTPNQSPEQALGCSSQSWRNSCSGKKKPNSWRFLYRIIKELIWLLQELWFGPYFGPLHMRPLNCINWFMKIFRSRGLLSQGPECKLRLHSLTKVDAFLGWFLPKIIISWVH